MLFNRQQFQEPDPPQPFKWLQDGKLYPVKPERRGDNFYWYMTKMIHRRTHRVYLGGLNQLNIEILENAVKHIEHQEEK